MSYSHRVECERLQHALRAAVARAEAAEAKLAELAELVPSEWSERAYDDKDIGYESGWNDCIAAILRNIEGSK